MTPLTLLMLVLLVGVAVILQIATDPRMSKTFVGQTFLAIAVYATHVAIAVVVMLYWLPWGPDAALGVTVAMVGWIGLGVLGLIRFAPRLREPPRWLMHVGLIDIVCVLMIGG